MRPPFKILSVLILCYFSFVFGSVYSERNYYKSVTEGYVKLSEMFISDQSMETHLLIHVFESYEESKDKANEELKRLIAMKYTRKERFSDIFGDSHGGESDLYQTNKRIERFLLANPLEQCKSIPKNQMLQCNLDNILNFD